MVYDLGKICPRIRGVYDPNETYDILDIVSYNGSAYMCKNNGTTGKLPTLTTYWLMIAQAGQSGEITPEIMAQIVQLVMQQGVVVDLDYARFKQNTEQAVQNIRTPNNGRLTIKRNGLTLAQFEADQSNNTTIDIQVPTSIADLGGGNSMRNTKVDYETDDVTIDKVEPGMLMEYVTPLHNLVINGWLMDMTSVEDWNKLAEFYTYESTLIRFVVDDELAELVVPIPACRLHDCANIYNSNDKSLHFVPGNSYELEVSGPYVFVREFKDVIPE